MFVASACSIIDDFLLCARSSSVTSFSCTVYSCLKKSNGLSSSSFVRLPRAEIEIEDFFESGGGAAARWTGGARLLGGGRMIGFGAGTFAVALWCRLPGSSGGGLSSSWGGGLASCTLAECPLVSPEAGTSSVGAGGRPRTGGGGRDGTTVAAWAT